MGKNRRSHYKKKGTKVSHYAPRSLKDVKPIKWDQFATDKEGRKVAPETRFVRGQHNDYHSLSSPKGNKGIVYPKHFPNPNTIIIDANTDHIDVKVIIENLVQHGIDPDEIRQDYEETFYLTSLIRGVLVNGGVREIKVFGETIKTEESVIERYDRLETLGLTDMVIDAQYNTIMDLIELADGKLATDVSLQYKTIEKTRGMVPVIDASNYTTDNLDDRPLTHIFKNYFGQPGYDINENLYLVAAKIINLVYGLQSAMEQAERKALPEQAEEQAKESAEIIEKTQEDLSKIIFEAYQKETTIKEKGRKTSVRIEEPSELTSKEQRTAQRIFEKPQGVDLLSELDKALEKLTVSEEIIIPEEIIKEKRIGSSFENLESVEEILDNWEPPVRKEKEESE
ncbi:hypothetical protein LCGC14_0174860 [marine sediment metagenome]|uniref:Uncharacterized protein n=1 Tax=marine sediment metagenome TaxID=412755 RepID=A0A0F9V7C1_9ZZZZ